MIMQSQAEMNAMIYSFPKLVERRGDHRVELMCYITLTSGQVSGRVVLHHLSLSLGPRSGHVINKRHS